jgi:DNA-directed RNA polymerase specialized sigma24 family protein
MATLRPKDQELLHLVSSDGLSPAQAGAVLGMNANTARVRLSRARARLQSVLAAAGSQLPADPHPEVPHAQS